MKKLIYTLPLILLSIASCSNSSEDDLIEKEELEEGTKITYTKNIKSIIDNNCVSCHNNPPVNGAPSNYSTYQKVSGGASGILNRISKQAGASGAMPIGGPRLPQVSIDLFEQWINDGMLE